MILILQKSNGVLLSTLKPNHLLFHKLFYPSDEEKGRRGNNSKNQISKVNSLWDAFVIVKNNKYVSF